MTVQRQDSQGKQLFVCPNSNCDSAFSNPQCLNRHCKECFLAYRSDPKVVPATTSEPDINQPTPASTLAIYDLVADHDLCVLICRKCQYAVNPNARCVRLHIRDKHAGKVLPSLNDLAAALDAHEPALRSDNDPELAIYTNPGQELVASVASLSVQNGYRCRLCSYYCLEMDTILWHVVSEHKESRSNAHAYERCQVQTLFSGLNSITI